MAVVVLWQPSDTLPTSLIGTCVWCYSTTMLPLILTSAQMSFALKHLKALSSTSRVVFL